MELLPLNSRQGTYLESTPLVELIEITEPLSSGGETPLRHARGGKENILNEKTSRRGKIKAFNGS